VRGLIRSVNGRTKRNINENLKLLVWCERRAVLCGFPLFNRWFGIKWGIAMGRWFARSLVALTFATLGPAHARAGIIFSDNFNTGASPLWGNEVGSWFAAGGVYDSQFPSNNPPTYTGLPFVLSDFSIDVDVNLLQDGGIWLRSAGNTNGVLLVTGGHLGTGTGLYWHVVTNGSFSGILNEVTGLFTPGVSNAHIRVEVSGNSYSAFVNGSATAATTLTTGAFATGRVGLYDFSNQTFDNVVVAVPDVAAVPEPSSLILFTIGFVGIVGRGRWPQRRA
jgi:hypothetical protein